MFSFFLLKIGEKEGRRGPAGEGYLLVTVGGGRCWGKRVGGWIQCKKCVCIYVNAKTVPVETIPEMGGGGNKGEQWRGWIQVLYLIHCKNLYKCHNVPPPSTTIKGKGKKKVHRKNQTSNYILQSHSNKTSMVLSQKIDMKTKGIE
jgi:hypothetical protein